MIAGISGQALARVRSLSQILALLSDLDVRWIEIWPANLEGGIDPENDYSGKDLGRAKEILEEHGIGVACVTMPGSFIREMVEDEGAYLCALRAAVDTAEELGSHLVNSYCFHWALGHNGDVRPFISMLRIAAGYASDRGVILVLENEAHDASGTVEGMLRILEGVGSEAVKTNYDPTNYYQAGDEPFPYAYRRLEGYIGYVHLKNGCVHDPVAHSDVGRGGTMPKLGEDEYIHYCPIPEGAVNIEGLLSQLQRDRYSGFCTLEPHVPAQMVEDYYQVEISYLRRRGVH
jgi:sugar phosphate isomerase/epimerase